MANKYCNIVGTNSIKDEFKKITEGFDKVETDNNGVKARLDKHAQGTAERHKSEDINYDGAVGGANNLKDALDYLDERVDQIITTPAEGVSAQEIIDARKGKISLGERIDEIDTQMVDYASKVSNIISVDKAGAVGDGITDDTDAIYAAINAGGKGATIIFEKGKPYLISRGIIPLERQTIDLNGATIKKSSLFDGSVMADNGGAPAVFTIINKNCTVKNGFINGNKANVTTTAPVNCGVLVTTNRSDKEAENTVIENMYVYDMAHSAYFIFGGTKNTSFNNCHGDNNYSLFGVEIWGYGDATPENITLKNMSGSNEYGVTTAGCNGLSGENINATATHFYALSLYCGDAGGNLTDVEFRNCKFKHTGTSQTVHSSALIPVGDLSGQYKNVEFKLTSCTFENTNAGNAQFRNKCKPTIDNCIFKGGTVGVYVFDCDGMFKMVNSKITNTRNSAIITTDKIMVDNCIVEFANTDNGNVDIISMGLGSKYSQIKNSRIGAKSNENGRYAINITVPSSIGLRLENLELHDINGGQAYIPSAVKNKSFIKNVTGQSSLELKPSGLTANRPTLTTTDIGFVYFDTTINKPIYWTGSAWVDAIGTTV